MDVRSFLYIWCDKQGKFPNFSLRAAGPKKRQRFLCELRVKGYPYMGWGNSTNKKDAQFNAIRDFVSYLVRQNIVNESEVPGDTFQKGEEKMQIITTASGKTVFSGAECDRMIMEE